MKVWWCERHQAESVGTILDRPHARCWKAWANKFDLCRMVEMQLVPTDTRTETQCPNCKCIYELEKVP